MKLAEKYDNWVLQGAACANFATNVPTLRLVKQMPRRVDLAISFLARGVAVDSILIEDCYVGVDSLMRLAETVRDSHSITRLTLNSVKTASFELFLKSLESALSSPKLESFSLLGTTLSPKTLLQFGLAAKKSYIDQISLSQNKISEDSCSELVGFLLSFPAQLREIRINENPIGNLGAKLLYEALRGNKTVERLELQDAGITFEGAKQIAALIYENHRYIRAVDLRLNKIGKEGAAAISDVLAKRPNSLRELDLRRTEICAGGVDSLFVALNASNNSVLISLDVSGVMNWKDMNVALSGAFYDFLRLNKSLTRLAIGGNNFHVCVDTAKFASALSLNSTLIDLSLADSAITQELMEKLAGSMMKTIERLSLRGCHFMGKDAGCVLGSRILKEGRKLQELDVSMCGFGNEWAKGIAEGLATSTSIRKLNMNQSHIGDEGVKALSAALTANRSLVELNLDHADITLEGAKCLAKAVTRNKSLVYVSLRLDSTRVRERAALSLIPTVRPHLTVEL